MSFRHIPNPATTAIPVTESNASLYDWHPYCVSTASEFLPEHLEGEVPHTALDLRWTLPLNLPDNFHRIHEWNWQNPYIKPVKDIIFNKTTGKYAGNAATAALGWAAMTAMQKGINKWSD